MNHAKLLQMRNLYSTRFLSLVVLLSYYCGLLCFDYNIDLQIVEMRRVLLQKLQNNRNVEVKNSESSTTLDSSQEGIKVSERREKNIPSMEKELTNIVNRTGRLEIDDNAENTEWLRERD